MLENAMVTGADAHYDAILDEGNRWAAAEEAAEAARERKIAAFVTKLMDDPATLTDVLYQRMAQTDASADALCKTAASLLIHAHRGVCIKYELAHLLRTLATEEAGDVLPFENPERYL